MKASVQGILGISPLASLLDLVDSIPVDYMHCVLEGVTRWLPKAWFDSSHTTREAVVTIVHTTFHFRLLTPPIT